MRRGFVLSVLIAGISGCATIGPASDPPYYAPNPSAVLLQHKGDIRATATASYGSETVTGAYALTLHWGLLASGAATLHKSGDKNGNQYSGQIGAGFFDTVLSSHLLRELYGGFGWGSANAAVENVNSQLDFWHQEISGKENRNFWNGWIQGDAGYNDRNFAFFAILRIEYVDVYHDVTKGTVATYDGVDDPALFDTTYSTRGASWLFTPALDARVCIDPIQFFATIFEPIAIHPTRKMVSPLAAAGVCYRF